MNTEQVHKQKTRTVCKKQSYFMCVCVCCVCERETKKQQERENARIYHGMPLSPQKQKRNMN